MISAGARRRRPCGLVEPIAGAGAASAADVGVGGTNVVDVSLTYHSVVVVGMHTDV